MKGDVLEYAVAVENPVYEIGERSISMFIFFLCPSLSLIFS